MIKEIIANGVGSPLLVDLDYKLKEVSGKIDDLNTKYKELEAEMKATHLVQDAEWEVHNPSARAKRQRQQMRQGPMGAVASALFAPADRKSVV